MRPLDKSRLNTIVEKLTNDHNLYTTFVVLIDEKCNITTLKTPGKYKVQVIGGNHTRAALQSPRTDDEDIRVLSVEQSLYVAYMNNEMHETSRRMTLLKKYAFKNDKKKKFFQKKAQRGTKIYHLEGKNCCKEVHRI